MFGLFNDLVLRTILIVAITDSIIYYVLNRNPARLTPFFMVEVIVVTVVPLIISLWYDIVYKKEQV